MCWALTKATKRPLPDMAGAREASVAWVLLAERLTRSARPREESKTKMSATPLVSVQPLTTLQKKLEARDLKATLVPSSEM